MSLLAGCAFEHGRPVVDDARRPDTMQVVIDARAIDAPPKPIDARMCPPMIGCTAFQCPTTTSCYYYCTTKTTWQMAQDACDDVPNGCLVTINDQDEQDCIVANVMPTFANFPWIGFRQSPTAAEPAAGWSFVCGQSSYVAPNWGMDEPNNIGDEDCAGMSETGFWFDAGCAEMGRYVCEVP